MSDSGTALTAEDVVKKEETEVKNEEKTEEAKTDEVKSEEVKSEPSEEPMETTDNAVVEKKEAKEEEVSFSSLH